MIFSTEAPCLNHTHKSSSWENSTHSGKLMAVEFILFFYKLSPREAEKKSRGKSKSNFLGRKNKIFPRREKVGVKTWSFPKPLEIPQRKKSVVCGEMTRKIPYLMNDFFVFFWVESTSRLLHRVFRNGKHRWAVSSAAPDRGRQNCCFIPWTRELQF